MNENIVFIVASSGVIAIAIISFAVIEIVKILKGRGGK